MKDHSKTLDEATKKSEEELKISREELERRVAERTASLNEANERLRQEISERQRIEEALRVEREQLLSIFEGVNAVIVVVDQETYEILYTNPFTKNLYGKELIGGQCYAELHGAAAPCEQCLSGTVCSLQGEPYEWDYHNTTVGRDFLAVDRLIRWPGGRDAKFHLALDVTERKKAEEELKQARHYLDRIINSVADPIFVKNEDHEWVLLNDAYCAFMGYACKELVGKSDYDFFPKSEADAFWEKDDIVFRTGRESVNEENFTDRNGFTHTIVTKKSLYVDPGGKKYLVGVIRDVTERERAQAERRRLESRLQQAQKMEAVGTLAGGIAHDFNNLLQVTLGYSELLMAEKAEDDPECADLRKIQQAARSGAELVKGLLTFSREVECKLIPIDLNARIGALEQLLRRTIPRMIDIRFSFSENLQRVNADPAQIEQVIMNLALNARDAVTDGGSITVETANVTVDDRCCSPHPEIAPGDYVLLSVSDTGHGMNCETLDHIFEPFYTTKEVGRGTGLGLAMVYGIVKQHGGHIICSSEVGRGTRFEVYLPAISAKLQDEADPAGEMLAFGAETVLLVDDEAFVRDLGQRILSKAGYTVLTAANGMEALDLYVKKQDEIALVVLDLIMPAMGGRECLGKLVRVDPQVRVLVASGYSAEATITDCLAAGAKGFVTKPFQMKDLLKQVRRVLDEG